MQDKLIYIADDEVKIQDLIKMFLKKEGYEVETFSDGNLLLEAFRRKSPDMILLDIMMPKLDGLKVCTEIRKESEVPIIIISAKDTEGDKIAGLMLGSDDYMTKPFSPVELVLRVKSIFKRIELQKNYKEKQDVIYILDLIFYPDRRYALCNGIDLKLTPMEFNLFLYLIENKNKGVSREELLNKVWGFDSEVDTRATDDMIKRIRKKLMGANSKVRIETLWGFGFMISDDEK
ncbi:response regulator transcription factor [Clostridium intestinale]|uniref:Stage 0 sporulation protein A homolog n=1 Tax=Clostridium intestinale DSM 6191 TaxID=1121320 RepID=A0A1M6AQG9_9CLOT|nr:response regulator transcription factor [Clostridium intestinale]SHI38647.1 DNA-binding response regulator, OmpR family, contains REC and winged-helix (wHTH) domain [Clostridium intestinale DSM 6191]